MPETKMDELCIDLNAKDKNAWTAIVFACKHGHNDVVKNEKFWKDF